MAIPWSAALLALLVFEGKDAHRFDPWKRSARYELEYRVDVGALAKKGAAVRVWLPTPTENTYQKVLSRRVDSPWISRETFDPFHNRIVFLEPAGKVNKSDQVVMRFVVERKPATGVDVSRIRADTPLDPKRYLGPYARIPLKGVIGRLGEKLSRGLPTDAGKVHAFYDYVVKSMRYAKKGVGWGRGDAIWACNARYGNCTDFHSLFIGLARSQGIAARFVIGFPIHADQIEGTVKGYHCWAEVFDRTRGWLPLDASEANKSGLPGAYFGVLPSDRVEFTVGRDLILEPPQQASPLNFFIYPYAEVDGKRVADVPWTLTFRRLGTFPRRS